MYSLHTRHITSEMTEEKCPSFLLKDSITSCSQQSGKKWKITLSLPCKRVELTLLTSGRSTPHPYKGNGEDGDYKWCRDVACSVRRGKKICPSFKKGHDLPLWKTSGRSTPRPYKKMKYKYKIYRYGICKI